jgi:WASH complex subunit strumpellin
MVLQVIPQLVFYILGFIIDIFTEKLKNETFKFDKAELASLAQFDDRLEIAKYNHEISVFAKSILNMESYLLGVI